MYTSETKKKRQDFVDIECKYSQEKLSLLPPRV